MFLRWLLGSRNRKKDTEEWEAEVKILHVSEDSLKEKLAQVGAEKVFEGKVFTTWLKKSLLERVNARIRVSISRDGRERFFWTIKSTPEGDEPTEILKNKSKKQEEASSILGAKKALAKELKRRGIIVAPSFLTSKLSIEKTRTSYVCRGGECAGLRFDFDSITSVDGEPLETPLSILEIEDVSRTPSKEKERKILTCAESLGLSIDREHASSSTRKLLNKLGYRK